MDSALSMVGLALRAGRLEAGEEAAGDACRDMRCRLLLVAADAGESTLRQAERSAELGRCLTLPLPYTKAELGAALGRGACALAAVTDLGLAAAITEKLPDRERYEETLGKLRLKAERAAARKTKKTGETGRKRTAGKPVQYNRKQRKQGV